jgi:serine/threonine protein kinase
VLLHVCPSCGRCFDHRTDQCEADRTALDTSWLLPRDIAGRYRLDKVIGEGGMGTVFRASDELLCRPVALKIIKAEHASDPGLRLRFEREAQAAARIEHHGVVGVFDFGELESGECFIVMELLNGHSLGRVVDACGRGTPAHVGSLLRQGAAGLGAAHRAGLVHRDIKPSNIMLLPDPPLFRVKLLDFGVVRDLRSATRTTSAGRFVGTPLFMSPEQALCGRVDARSDIYSFATVAFRALTGRHASRHIRMVDILLDVTYNEAPLVSSLVPEAPKKIDEAFRWAMAKSPDDRPEAVEQWVDSFVDTLEAMPSTTQGWACPQGLLGPLPTELPPRSHHGSTMVTRAER